MQLLRPEGLHFFLILRFACARYSLFTIYHSLFTENNGSSNAKEAASSGVRFAYWGSFANRPRRETAVGSADPALTNKM